MGREKNEIKNKYLINKEKPNETDKEQEGEELEILDELCKIKGFTDFMESTSTQYAIFFHTDLKGFDRLSTNISHKRDWMNKLEVNEKLDFLIGWKRNTNYCRIVYRENLKEIEELNYIDTENMKIGSFWPSNSLSKKEYLKKVEIWKTRLKESQEELKFIDSELEHYKEVSPKRTEDLGGLDTNQRITLLEQIGFFDMEKIRFLSDWKKAELVSKIIGRNTKNIYDYRRDQDNPEKSKKGSKYRKDYSKIYKILSEEFNL